MRENTDQKKFRTGTLFTQWNVIIHNQKLRKISQNVTKWECIPCNTMMSLVPTNNCNHNIWKHPNKRKINIYHQVSCKSNYVFYQLECLLCKIQYVGKSKTSFHIKLEGQKGYKNPNAMEAYIHFRNWNHVFHKPGKFILIEQLNNITNISRKTLKQRLKDRENYWIKKT